MTTYETEDRTRQKRVKSEQAVSLATRSRWEDAAQVNREILELFPNEVDAHNRLGKALMELGRYAEARDAYSAATRIDPSNSIAAKNLQRLSKLAEQGASAPAPMAVDPRLFIEESGKTTVTHLTDVRRTDAVAKLSAGDALRLDRRGQQVFVVNQEGEEIGRVEPKLEQDLLGLLDLGNTYNVFVTAANEQSVNVIIRETHRAAAMGVRPSFRPTAAAEGGVRAYTREGLLRYNVDDDDDDDDDDEGTEREPAAADADTDGPEETPLQDVAEEEDAEEST